MRIVLQRNREQRAHSQLERDRVHTGSRRIGATPGLRSRTTRVLAIACVVVVVPIQQPANSLVISQDQFDDVGCCAHYPCERD
jgi:hypothetical protein